MTITKKCPPKALQACAHYYSAIKFAQAKSEFTCSESHRDEGRSEYRRFVDQWSNQHYDKTWRAFTAASLDAKGAQIWNWPEDVKKPPREPGPNCERDEWPPSYFMPLDDASRQKPEWGQMIRWLPAIQNTWGGQVWRGFCSKNDASEGNNRRIRPRRDLIAYSSKLAAWSQAASSRNAAKNPKDNKLKGSFEVRQAAQVRQMEPDDSYNLVPFQDGGVLTKEKGYKGENPYYTLGLDGKKEKVKPKKMIEYKGKPQIVTDQKGDPVRVTSRWAEATYTNAIFEMSWEFPDGEPPKAENNWYLEQNDCWPKAIIPEDPGYVLLRDDPWYKSGPGLKAAEYRDLYLHAPDEARLDKAKGLRPDVKLDADGRKKVPDVSERPKASKRADGFTTYPAHFKRDAAARRLQLVNDRLYISDDTFNSTRALTPEEIDREVEVINCADRDCTEERRALGYEDDDEDTIFIRGAPLPTIPSANIAEPTASSTFVHVDPPVKRTHLSASIPVITGSPQIENMKKANR
ncbi:hypothetical protein MRB53_039985 [Persea americana]|nr:hypothetical protein MRB53_039985 [Persea americana]